MATPPSIHPDLSLSGITSRLSAGADPQALLGEVVDHVVADTMADPCDTIHIMLQLARHGARVATAQQGCALERLITECKRSRPGLILGLVPELSALDDELPFHVMARHYLFPMSKGWMDTPHIRKCLAARDPQGRTVSHWLWDEQSALVASANASRNATPDTTDEDRLAKAWLSNLRLAWDLQGYLQQLGAGLEIPDDEGLTAFQLCADRLAKDDALLFTTHPACNFMRVLQANDKMLQATPPTGQAPANAMARL